MRRRANARLEARAAIASRRPRSLVAVACGLVVALSAACATAVPAAVAAACPNEAVRVQQGSTDLPECRAYEKVSPQDKGEADVGGETWASLAISADDGRSFAYSALGRYPGVTKSGALPSIYRATRTGEGWVNEGINPPYRAYPGGCGGCSAGGYTSYIAALSPSLDQAIVATNAQLSPGASDGNNFYRQTNPGSNYQLLSPGVPSGADMFINNGDYTYYSGVSRDLSTVVFATNYPVTADAPAQTIFGGSGNLFASVNGHVEYISKDEAGDPLPAVGDFTTTQRNAVSGPESQNTVSDDGSRIFFSTRSGGAALYVRIDAGTPAAHTQAIPGGIGPAYAASPTGSLVVYQSTNGISMYDLDADEVYTPEALSVGATFIAASDDARTVYFVSSVGQPGHPLEPGEQALYQWQHAADSEHIRLVTTFLPGDTDTDSFLQYPTVPGTQVRAVSPDGQELVFVADEEIPGFDTNGKLQVFLFDAGDQTAPLSCISCPPQGLPDNDAVLSAASHSPNPGSLYAQHFEARKNLASNGEVFFQTADSLVREDVNGKVDVYVWHDGKAWLVSTGTGGDDARFVGASPDGANAFFVTRKRILPSDRDLYADLYVARVGGGFPGEDRPAPCEGDACQPTTGSRTPSSIGSRDVHGAGDVADKPRRVRPRVAVLGITTVGGAAVKLRVKVSGAGLIQLKGRAIRSTRKRVRMAGRYTVRSVLRPGVRRALRKGRRQVRLRVVYRARGGVAVTKRVTVNVKQHNTIKRLKAGKVGR